RTACRHGTSAGYIMDTVSPERRSAIMANIRSRDTTPELVVRRFLHSKGLRFRLHRRDLPVKPAIVFPSRKLCAFVHGCFWHGCPNCIDGTRRVRSNIEFWRNKVRVNRERDARHAATLQANGWSVLTIWECEIKSSEILKSLAEGIRSSAMAKPRRS